MGRAAAFLDRDGTIIAEKNYLAEPAAVELLEGSAAALRELAAAGYALVIVTNQSGIARGRISHAQSDAVQRRVEALLQAEDVHLDGVYVCPHHPEHGPPCDCRKPGLALYRRAAGDLDIDLAGSAFIGDKASDVEPALLLGGRGILVLTGQGRDARDVVPPDVAVVADLRAATRLLLASHRVDPNAPPGYPFPGNPPPDQG